MMTLQELSDREQIREVLVHYAQGLDRREFDQVASCFTTDAQAEYSGTVLAPGVDTIVKYVSGVARLAATTHFMGETAIMLDGDTAETKNYTIAYLVNTETSKVHVRGLRYHDWFVRTPDGWRIRKRVHTADWMFETPLSPSTNMASP
jgi:3-phenylpropionate/cinnamic acid dioxygenase small subunit